MIDSAGLDKVLMIDRAERAPKKAQDVEALIPLLADKGLSLPPSKVMDTLRTRRVVFVEGEESDYEQFLLAFGQVVSPDFRVVTRGLSVFEIGEGRKDWPFDAIAAFQRLIGVELRYVYVSDRDFLLPDEVQKREQRAAAESQAIQHLSWRNRECYLLNPKVLSRLLRSKHETRIADPNATFPEELSEERIKQWLLDYSTQARLDVQTALTVANEPYLRGDAQHRTEKTRVMNEYFRDNYDSPLSNGEVPLVLLDGKAAIRAFRNHVAESFSLHFRDTDIISSFNRAEIPSDIDAILTSIAKMFPLRAPTSASTTQVDSAEIDAGECLPLFPDLTTSDADNDGSDS